jgi:hypothetical protein
MENITDKIFIQDRKLKRLFISYIVVSVIFLAVIVLCIVVREYADSLNETSKGLQSFRANIARIKDTTIDMKQSVETINTTISPDYFSNSSEKQLLMGLDVLKTTMKNDAVMVTEFLYTDAEINLPVNIRGVMSSYSSLVNDIGKLQSLKFPFFFIKSITIKKGETIQVVKETNEIGERKATVYEINGELRLPKRNENAKEDGKAGSSSAAGSGAR